MTDTPHVVWRNTLTIAGGILASVTGLFMLSFLAIDLTSSQPSPYIGLFTFLVFPCILVVAVAMILVGLAWGRRNFRRQYGTTEGIRYLPRVDFTDARHRRALGAVAAVLAAAVPVIGVMSYQGYHYTDSNEFCGKVCHQVMEPQFSAHQQSPHAHVNCAECHIGAGASWYVKSKLSGIRQVFAVALNSFPRPIPPAIQELRPATETCRQCHWPSKFFGDQLVNIDHYADDEANTHSRIRMLVKTGGSDPTTGPPSGIHWHMALGFSIEYVAIDDRLQNIPWVKTTDQSTKQVRIYRSDGLRSHDPPPQGTRRTVDCMDCHNRPTHIFRSPGKAADSVLNVNPALQSLPFARRELVRVLSQPYLVKEEGLATIAGSLQAFYREKFADVWANRRADVEKLGELAQGVYGSTAFPEMNVSWRTYPDNIGHKIFPGCFRCHEGKHVDDEGRTLSHECSTCHEFLVPNANELGPSVVQVGGFVHPLKLEGSHTTLRCDQCHTGGVSPQRTCAGCHTDVAGFRAGTLDGWARGVLPKDPMADAVDCEGCHNLSAPTTAEAIDKNCTECHSDDEDRFRGMVASWSGEVSRLLAETADRTRNGDRAILKTLRRAGPLHNMEATRAIVRELLATPSDQPIDLRSSPRAP